MKFVNFLVVSLTLIQSLSLAEPALLSFEATGLSGALLTQTLSDTTGQWMTAKTTLAGELDSVVCSYWGQCTVVGRRGTQELTQEKAAPLYSALRAVRDYALETRPRNPETVKKQSEPSFSVKEIKCSSTSVSFFVNNRLSAKCTGTFEINH